MSASTYNSYRPCYAGPVTTRGSSSYNPTYTNRDQRGRPLMAQPGDNLKRPARPSFSPKPPEKKAKSTHEDLDGLPVAPTTPSAMRKGSESDRRGPTGSNAVPRPNTPSTYRISQPSPRSGKITVNPVTSLGNGAQPTRPKSAQMTPSSEKASTPMSMSSSEVLSREATPQTVPKPQPTGAGPARSENQSNSRGMTPRKDDRSDSQLDVLDLASIIAELAAVKVHMKLTKDHLDARRKQTEEAEKMTQMGVDVGTLLAQRKEAELAASRDVARLRRRGEEIEKDLKARVPSLQVALTIDAPSAPAPAAKLPNSAEVVSQVKALSNRVDTLEQEKISAQKKQEPDEELRKQVEKERQERAELQQEFNREIAALKAENQTMRNQFNNFRDELMSKQSDLRKQTMESVSGFVKMAKTRMEKNISQEQFADLQLELKSRLDALSTELTNSVSELRNEGKALTVIHKALRSRFERFEHEAGQRGEVRYKNFKDMSSRQNERLDQLCRESSATCKEVKELSEALESHTKRFHLSRADFETFNAHCKEDLHVSKQEFVKLSTAVTEQRSRLDALETIDRDTILEPKEVIDALASKVDSFIDKTGSQVQTLKQAQSEWASCWEKAIETCEDKLAKLGDSSDLVISRATATDGNFDKSKDDIAKWDAEIKNNTKEMMLLKDFCGGEGFENRVKDIVAKHCDTSREASSTRGHATCDQAIDVLHCHLRGLEDTMTKACQLPLQRLTSSQNELKKAVDDLRSRATISGTTSASSELVDLFRKHQKVVNSLADRVEALAKQCDTATIEACVTEIQQPLQERLDKTLGNLEGSSLRVNHGSIDDQFKELYQADRNLDQKHEHTINRLRDVEVQMMFLPASDMLTKMTAVTNEWEGMGRRIDNLQDQTNQQLASIRAQLNPVVVAIGQLGRRFDNLTSEQVVQAMLSQIGDVHPAARRFETAISISRESERTLHGRILEMERNMKSSSNSADNTVIHELEQRVDGVVRRIDSCENKHNDVTTAITLVRDELEGAKHNMAQWCTFIKETKESLDSIKKDLATTQENIEKDNAFQLKSLGAIASDSEAKDSRMDQLESSSVAMRADLDNLQTAVQSCEADLTAAIRDITSTQLVLWEMSKDPDAGPTIPSEWRLEA